MSNVRNAGQGLSSEAIGADRGQVLKGLELGRGEALAQQMQVILLHVVSLDRQRVMSGGGSSRGCRVRCL
jgi:hypothetical protein